MAAIGRHRKSSPVKDIFYILGAAIVLGTTAALVIAIGVAVIFL